MDKTVLLQGLMQTSPIKEDMSVMEDIHHRTGISPQEDRITMEGLLPETEISSKGTDLETGTPPKEGISPTEDSPEGDILPGIGLSPLGTADIPPRTGIGRMLIPDQDLEKDRMRDPSPEDRTRDLTVISPRTDHIPEMDHSPTSGLKADLLQGVQGVHSTLQGTGQAEPFPRTDLADRVPMTSDPFIKKWKGERIVGRTMILGRRKNAENALLLDTTSLSVEPTKDITLRSVPSARSAITLQMSAGLRKNFLPMWVEIPLN